MKIIARIRSDFPEKFGIPRQSGLIEELKHGSYSSRNTAIRMRCAVWRDIRICGCLRLGSYSGELVSYGASAAPGRKSESWCFCNALSISAEPDRFVIGEDSFD